MHGLHAVLLALAHGGLRGQEAEGPWRSAPRAAVVTQREVRAPNSPPVIVRHGVLMRVRPGREERVGCTVPEGPGRVLDLASDPAGLVFVAAEHGIFVLDPLQGELDPLTRAEGAPPGRPTSVHVDAERRLWVATDEAVGPLDPSFGWGRTIAPAPGAPGPGPYRVGSGPAQSLLIETSGGVFSYVPGAAAPPSIAALAADGRALAPLERVERAYGEPLSLSVSGAAGLTFRWRADGHHVWRDAPGGVALVEGLAPGTHPVDVVTLDRDLARSAPVRILLEVAPPQALQKPVLFALAACAGALALLFFLARAQRAGGGLHAYARGAVSAALAFVVGLQVVAGLVPHAKGWPFVGFSMYCSRYRAGEVIHRPELVGLSVLGGERVLAPQDVGVALDSPWQVLRPLLDGGEPAVHAYVSAYNDRFPDGALRGLKVQARRVRLTPGGPVHVAPLVLGRWVLEGT